MTTDETPRGQRSQSLHSASAADTGPEGGSSRGTGLLYVEMDCPPQFEEEFHIWYNTEHVPERLGIQGFLNGRRYQALLGSPRWLASYDLTSTAVLRSPEYLAVMGRGRSIGTKRTSFYCQLRRAVYELSWSGGGLSLRASEGAQGLLAVRYDGAAAEVESFNAHHDAEIAPRLLELPEVLAIRRFNCVDPAPEQLVICDLANPWIVQTPEFRRLWTEGWEASPSSTSMLRRALYTRIL